MHKKLMKKSSFYASWHKQPQYKLFNWLLFVLIAGFVTTILVSKIEVDLSTSVGVVSDLTPPSVGVTYPPDGATVSGRTYITVMSDDDSGRISQMSVYIDGNLTPDSYLTSLARSRVWDTTSYAPGPHTIYAKVTDPSGNITTSKVITINVSNGSGGTDTTPPIVPANLTATAVSCGQVNLSWAASTDLNGSGVRSYHIYRNGEIKNIAAGRTALSDTVYIQSSAALTYYLTAEDWAGNKSAQSNQATVSTPSCSQTVSEEVVDNVANPFFPSLDRGPLGKATAAHGSRSAIIYQKLNTQLTHDTYLYLKDEDTGAASKFLLHSYPGYNQIEAEYVLTGLTELWTLSFEESLMGRLQVNQYQLSGSPIPTSARLISSKSLGDQSSSAQSLVRLNSGALLAVWNEDRGYTGPVAVGFAYRSPGGVWSVQFPVYPEGNLSNVMYQSQFAVAQHPADNSIWVFDKRDSTSYITAFHFTETPDGLNLDWINNAYIKNAQCDVAQLWCQQSTSYYDGVNGPEGEFPFLVAAADPARNGILLAYQSRLYQLVYIDPLYQGSGDNWNSIFLKQAPITIAQIQADGSKTFMPTPATTERISAFGFSALSDGGLHLVYLPVNHQTLTRNEVYATRYYAGSWSVPHLVGYGFFNFDANGGLPLVYSTDKPQIAFLTPDRMIRSFSLDGAPGGDLIAPSAAVTSPAQGSTVSGIVTLSADASDNVAVAGVTFKLDGAPLAPEDAVQPYNVSWNSAQTTNGSHTLTAVARDTSGNTSESSPVLITVNNGDAIAPAVVITNPPDGSTVKTQVTISASAADNAGVTKLELYIDGNLVSQKSGSSISYRWNSRKAGLGPHTIKAQAYDAAGNIGSVLITVSR